jgi:hypothetical protein
VREENPVELTDSEQDAAEPTNTTDSAVSRSPSLDSDACDKAMGTPELLEAIISFLPTRDIFANAQRVSRTWNAVAQSPSIQSRLWLRSPIHEVSSPVNYVTTHVHDWSPSLHLPSYMPMYSGSIANNSTYISQASGYRNVTIDRTDGTQYHKASLALAKTSSDSTRPTWFDMHLTEPRIKLAHLHVQQPRWDMGRKNNGIWASVQDADGLTFQTVLSVAHKIRDGFPVDLPGRDDTCVVIWFITEH